MQNCFEILKPISIIHINRPKAETKDNLNRGRKSFSPNLTSIHHKNSQQPGIVENFLNPMNDLQLHGGRLSTLPRGQEQRKEACPHHLLSLYCRSSPAHSKAGWTNGEEEEEGGRHRGKKRKKEKGRKERRTNWKGRQKDLFADHINISVRNR